MKLVDIDSTVHSRIDLGVDIYAWLCGRREYGVCQLNLDAHITYEGDGIKAALSDGRTLFAPDTRILAAMLVTAGVDIDRANCGDWRDGDMALMVGAAIALKTEMRRIMSLVE